MNKLAERNSKGQWNVRSAPPVLTRVKPATERAVVDALGEYVETLPTQRRHMLRRYRVAAVGHRIGGVGSVGIRNYVVLLFGSGETDALILQVKEALPPAAADGAPPLPHEFAEHQGQRVVHFQHLLQASGDILLGWTSIDGRSFYVRQLRNQKGSLALEKLGISGWQRYAYTCGALLARAHARGGDIRTIAGYCGSSNVLDKAQGHFAEAYGDQTVTDHAELVKAIRAKRIKAIEGV